MRKGKSIRYELMNYVATYGMGMESYLKRSLVRLLNPGMLNAPYVRKSAPAWLENAVIYQIYPQSYFDSNADGIGDIPGLIEKLDYIKDLGVDAVWLGPLFVSPCMDAGYDVADYCQVAPRYGTLEDVKTLFQEARQRGLRVIFDLVAGHTSDQHPWFQASAAKERGEFSDRFIWTDTRTRKPWPFFVKGAYAREGNYRKNFYDCQPALNYGYGIINPCNPWEQPVDAPGPRTTLKALKEVIRFWMDLGAGGFRVDLAASLIKRDYGFRKTVALWRDIRTWFEQLWPQGVLIAEWGEPAHAISAGFHIDFMLEFGSQGYRQLFVGNSGTFRRFSCYFEKRGLGSAASFIKNFRRHYLQAKDLGYVSIISANHDFQRPHCGIREGVDELKCAMTFFLTWPGLPTLYYGDEIGMRFIDDLPNKEGSELFPGANRAGSRTPMQWSRAKNAGFSDGRAEDLYLPIDPRPNRPDVASQVADPDSLLNYTKALIKLKKQSPAFVNMGRYQVLNGASLTARYPLAYLRYSDEEVYLIVLNPSGQAQNCLLDVNAPAPQFVAGKGVGLTPQGEKLHVRCEPVSYGIYKVKG